MKSLKYLTTLLLAIFFISFSSAAIAGYVEWEGNTQNIEITMGDSVDFEAEVFTSNPAMTLIIELYNSQGNEIHTFASEILNQNDYNNIYTVTPAMYSSVGTYQVTIQVMDSTGSSNTHTIYLTVNPILTPDTIPPVITLIGNNPQTIELGSSYVELNATATDNIEGDISALIIIDDSSVDTNTIGSYQVTYNVQDTAGNNATQVTRIVNVIDSSNPDIITPVITLLGNNPETIELDSVYSDAGATAEDETDGDITSSITVNNSVNTSVIGTYTVHYNVADSSGNNATQVTRIVNVIDSSDNEAPIISIIFPKDKTYRSKDIFFKVLVNENSTVKFSIDGESKITMDKTGDFVFEMDEYISYGTHEVVFYATDLNGNIGTASREFRVKKKSSPKKDSIVFNPYEYLNETAEETVLPQVRERNNLGLIIILFIGIGILIILLLIVLIRRDFEEKPEGIYEEELSTDELYPKDNYEGV